MSDDLPILDLESFVFHPPGPIGWAVGITNEDMEQAKEGIQKIIELEQALTFSEISIEPQVVDSQGEDVNIIIILPSSPPKPPWLLR